MNVFARLRNFFNEPAAIEQIKDKETVDSMYSHWRMRIFYSCFIGYTVFYLCKKNIAVALPGLSEEFGYTNTELGLLGSSLYLTYGIGKFVNGVLADGSDVRKFFPTALIMTAIANLCFALSAVFVTPGEVSFFGLPTNTILLWLFVFFWGASGWFQSAGFPAVAKSLTYWYSNSERGTKWSLWSCSHQVGTFLSVIVSGFLVAKFGWKMAFFVPATLAILVAIWLFNRLRDKPQSLGLPDIESYRGEISAKQAAECSVDNRSYVQVFKDDILFNKTIWMLAIAYVFVYVIRFGAEDWMIKYLSEAKANSLELASLKLSSLPLVGIAGTVCAGVISDKIFKGKRAPVNLIYLIGVVSCLVLLKFNTIGALDFVLIGLLGAFTYGPQMMIGGLCAVESSSKKVASAATGFTGTFGYIGAVLSATGTGFMVDKFGWNGALSFWIVSALICIAICLVLWKNEKQKAC
jgi:OPA family sugar phosphate sensor protein UhpC-like MFS transporter